MSQCPKKIKKRQRNFSFQFLRSFWNAARAWLALLMHIAWSPVHRWMSAELLAVCLAWVIWCFILDVGWCTVPVLHAWKPRMKSGNMCQWFHHKQNNPERDQMLDLSQRYPRPKSRKTKMTKLNIAIENDVTSHHVFPICVGLSWTFSWYWGNWKSRCGHCCWDMPPLLDASHEDLSNAAGLHWYKASSLREDADDKLHKKESGIALPKNRKPRGTLWNLLTVDYPPFGRARGHKAASIQNLATNTCLMMPGGHQNLKGYMK